MSLGCVRIRPVGFNPMLLRPARFRPGTIETFTERLNGRYRIAEDALDRYELFVGVDAAADITAAPDATSATLPFSEGVTLPGAGNREFNLIVLRRNKYDLVSLNRYQRTFVVSSGGEEQTQGPSAPEDESLTEHCGKVQVMAVYYESQDASPADTWLIYARSNGTDPDPSLDTPTEVTMVATNIYPKRPKLVYDIGPYSIGADVRVIVRTKRSSDSAESDNVNVSQLTITTPSAPVAGDSGATFLGQGGEQK